MAHARKAEAANKAIIGRYIARGTFSIDDLLVVPVITFFTGNDLQRTTAISRAGITSNGRPERPK